MITMTSNLIFDIDMILKSAKRYEETLRETPRYAKASPDMFCDIRLCLSKVKGQVEQLETEVERLRELLKERVSAKEFAK